MKSGSCADAKLGPLLVKFDVFAGCVCWIKVEEWVGFVDADAATAAAAAAAAAAITFAEFNAEEEAEGYEDVDCAAG